MMVLAVINTTPANEFLTRVGKDHPMDASQQESAVDDNDLRWWRKNGPVRPIAEHIEQFVGVSERRRDSVGLCLSGGGFRAALFHLGALRRLNELNLLSRIDRISAVSGGAILAAHLAYKLRDAWPEPGAQILNWDERIRDPFWEFASRNIRSAALSRGFGQAVHRLEQSYDNYLTHHMTLVELPKRPHISFGATELVYRRYWMSSRDFVGSTATVLMDPTKPINVLKQDWSVARAVAASSCFPPVFRPLNVWDDVTELYQRSLPRKGLLLTDGGVYDNIGYMGLWNRCGTVFVSDGGGVTLPADASALAKSGNAIAMVRRLMRYTAVQEYAGRGWQKAFLLSNLISGHQEGAYWSIKTKTTHYGEPGSYGYPHEEIVDGYIRGIRTDLNKFSKEEMQILENHGYLLASAAVNRHLSDSSVLQSSTEPMRIPHDSMMDPEAVKAALARSHERKFFFLSL